MPDLTNTDELIEKRIKIASTQTKSDDEVVQIAWLVDGLNVWYQTNGDRGHSPAEARRFVISSITRLIQANYIKKTDVEAAIPEKKHISDCTAKKNKRLGCTCLYTPRNDVIDEFKETLGLSARGED